MPEIPALHPAAAGAWPGKCASSRYMDLASRPCLPLRFHIENKTRKSTQFTWAEIA